MSTSYSFEFGAMNQSRMTLKARYFVFFIHINFDITFIFCGILQDLIGFKSSALQLNSRTHCLCTCVVLCIMYFFFV